MRKFWKNFRNEVSLERYDWNLLVCKENFEKIWGTIFKHFIISGRKEEGLLIYCWEPKSLSLRALGFTPKLLALSEGEAGRDLENPAPFQKNWKLEENDTLDF